MTRADAIDKARKLAALAERGVDGERTNARAMLGRHMQREGLTMADLKEPEPAPVRPPAPDPFYGQPPPIIIRFGFAADALFDTWRAVRQGEVRNEAQDVADFMKRSIDNNRRAYEAAMRTKASKRRNRNK